MKIEDISKQVIIPLIVSMAMGVFSVLWNSGTQKVLLEQNIAATEALSKAVTELRITVAVQGEKFVTKDELDRKLAPLITRNP
jgi:hypothetical protein